MELNLSQDFIIKEIGHLAYLLILTGISLAIGLVVAMLVLRTLRWFGTRNNRVMDGVMRDNIRTPAFIFFPLIFFYVALFVFEPYLLDLRIIDATVKILFIFSLISLMLGGVKTITLFIKKRFDISNEDNLRARGVHTQITVIQRITSFIIILFGIASFFLLFDELRSIGVSLIASAGVAGLAIGFAAQKTLANLLAGIQIAFAQPIRVEDAVVVEGEWGWVEEITLTYVVIRIWDLRRLVVPISYFIEKPFQNWTRNSATIIGSVYLYTDYTMPIEPLRQKLIELLTDNPRWDKNVQVVQVTNSTQDTIEIRMLMSAKNSPTTWDLRCEVREEMIKFIQEHYPEALPKTRASLEKDSNIKERSHSEFNPE